MTTLATFSNELAQLVTSSGGSVIQVLGARRPASGVVYGSDTIITTARAIGREDGLRIRLNGDETLDADLAGWDPAIGIAVLRARTPISVAAPAIADAEPRAGELIVALGRSWSNAITASPGFVAIVGGPLRTGRRREIPRVFRVTSAVHEGFAGGGVFDASGRLTGIATSSAIRGYTVAIPASIAWAAAQQVLVSGTPRRGFIGIAVQAVELPPAQRTEGRKRALVVLGVTPDAPAAAAGILVGDVVVDFDGHATESPGDLLDLLTSERVGRQVALRILRGGTVQSVPLTVAERTRGGGVRQ
jgi:S1-C subfamily serine protease